MIFYGTNSSRLKDGQLRNVKCPNCSEQTTMHYSVFGKYAYIYWIPIFPLGKTNVLECDNCKKTYKLKELPQPVKDKFETEKHRGVPFLHFSGLAIIALAIGYFSYANAKHKDLEAEYIKTPAVGDVYSVKTESKGHYSSIKVIEVKTDSVFVVFNNYEIDKKTGIDQIDKAENYSTVIDGYLKSELESLYKDNTIYAIHRD